MKSIVTWVLAELEKNFKTIEAEAERGNRQARNLAVMYNAYKSASTFESRYIKLELLKESYLKYKSEKEPSLVSALLNMARQLRETKARIKELEDVSEFMPMNFSREH